MSRIINVTDKFRIEANSNQYTVQQLFDVDPTNSPRFDPSKHSTDIRQEWKDIGYYGLRDVGLIAAIKSIVIRASVDKEDEISLKKYLKEIKEIADQVAGVIDDAFDIPLKTH